jgi:dTDP-glucose 4,6-dehydratase
MRGGRLFITGGTGTFGTWLLESLVAADRAFDHGLEAVVLTRDPDAFLARRPYLSGLDSLVFHRGDVATFDPPEGPFSHIIHAATVSSIHPERVTPSEMFETIYEGTRRTLDFARQVGARRYLFVSSGAVYGRQPPDCPNVAEDDPFAPNPLDPSSAYGEGKRAAEMLCALAGSKDGLKATVARVFTVVGPLVPLDMHFAIGNFLRDGLSGGPVVVGGDGTPYRSYIHMADLTAWLWSLLNSGRPGRAYNVGSDEALTIAELASKIAAIFGAEVRINREPVPGLPASRYVPSIRRARDELGLQIRLGLDDAIARTVNWLRQGNESDER